MMLEARRRSRTFAVVRLMPALMLTSILSVVSVARAVDDPIPPLAAACDAHVQRLQERVDTAQWWSSALLLLGASVAATGSALAGFLKRDSVRKLSGIVGALGAVLAGAPEVLPKVDKIEATLTAADRHRSYGAKVQAQLTLLSDPVYVTRLKRYAVARFTDCRSLHPPADVPELPMPSAPRLASLQAASPATASTLGESVSPTPPPEMVMPTPAKKHLEQAPGPHPVAEGVEDLEILSPFGNH